MGIATVWKMKCSQRLIARKQDKRLRLGLPSASAALIHLEQELIDMPTIVENIPDYNQKKLLMFRELTRIRTEKSRAARSKEKIKIDTARELLLQQNRPRKVRSVEKIKFDKEKHRLYEKKRRVGATLRKLLSKKKTNTLTPKENVKLNRLHQLYTNIYVKYFGIIVGDNIDKENDKYVWVLLLLHFFSFHHSLCTNCYFFFKFVE